MNCKYCNQSLDEHSLTSLQMCKLKIELGNEEEVKK